MPYGKMNVISQSMAFHPAENRKDADSDCLNPLISKRFKRPAVDAGGAKSVDIGSDAHMAQAVKKKMKKAIESLAAFSPSKELEKAQAVSPISMKWMFLLRLKTARLRWPYASAL